MSAVALKKRSEDSPFKNDPTQSFTIPARYYLDRDIHEQEKEAIFPMASIALPNTRTGICPIPSRANSNPPQ